MGSKLLDLIKKDQANSGGAYRDVIKMKDGEKKRIRFIDSFDEGLAVQFHQNWGAGYNKPCRKYKKEDCEVCEMDRSEQWDKGWKTYNMFVWNVYDYEQGKVVLLPGTTKKSSFVNQLVEIEEEYGDITLCDMILKRKGAGNDTAHSLLPKKEEEFEKEVEPFSKKEIMKIMFEAYNYDPKPSVEVDDDDDDDDDEDEKPKKKKASKSKDKPKKQEADDDDDDEEEKPKKAKKKAKPVEDDMDEDDDSDDDYDDDDWDFDED